MFQPHNRCVTFVLISADTPTLFGLPEAVPHTADRLDPGHRGPRGRELGPEPRHVNVHGPGLDEPVLPPDHVEDLFAAEHAAGRPDQRREQLELLRREVHAQPLHRHLEAVAVDLEIARLEVMLSAGRFGVLAPADDGPDAGNQLAGGERLGDVVVDAHLEAQDLVALLDTARGSPARGHRRFDLLHGAYRHAGSVAARGYSRMTEP